MSERDSTAFSTLVSSAKRSGLENLMEGVRSLMKMRKSRGPSMLTPERTGVRLDRRPLMETHCCLCDR